MATPIGDETTFLHELEIGVRAELTATETGQPLVDADGVPTVEWLLLDPHAPRYEVSLRALLAAVVVLEDGYGPARPPGGASGSG